MDNDLLCVVLFAASLSFAGISTELVTGSGGVTILGLGYALFIGTVVWTLTFRSASRSGWRAAPGRSSSDVR